MMDEAKQRSALPVGCVYIYLYGGGGLALQ